MAQPRAAVSLRDDDPADHHGFSVVFGHQQAKRRDGLAAGFDGEMLRRSQQIETVQLLIGALLLDHEHGDAQREQFIETLGT
ncbi:hypothetical protein GCM10009038_10760 [Salinicola rhizosphaerae]|uniref:Uncharacterized protein n=1 Tax=Salinicola rhizosphaerae TaxID=1443141 RepID=A0ABQ3DWC6_9GAMM|nr:hypothetical protein GCM10009038_10760 [Salinicola rhizosphaerae]